MLQKFPKQVVTALFSTELMRAKSIRSIVVVAIFFTGTLRVFSAIEPSSSDFDFFEKKIRPLFAERCYKCHSAQSEKLKGGFRLDSREGILKGGESGKPAVVPNAPEKSLLIEAIGYGNPDLQMPPKGKLSDAQIADLTEWVKIGAPWPQEAPAQISKTKSSFDLPKRRSEHWAWQPVKAPSLPRVKNKKWSAQPIDRFILAQLEANHLAPAPLVEKRTLIRRLYFDLTGLPPEPRDVENFLADKNSNAFEKVVDRLLASPQFGERWARHWLDLVRYSETLGHALKFA